MRPCSCSVRRHFDLATCANLHRLLPSHAKLYRDASSSHLASPVRGFRALNRENPETRCYAPPSATSVVVGVSRKTKIRGAGTISDVAINSNNSNPLAWRCPYMHAAARVPFLPLRSEPLRLRQRTHFDPQQATQVADSLCAVIN